MTGTDQQRVRRVQAQDVLLERGRDRGREAHREPPGDRAVQPPPGRRRVGRRRIIGRCVTLLPAAAHVPQPGRGGQRGAHRPPVEQAAQRAVHLPPVQREPAEQHRRTPHRRQQDDHQQHRVRDDLVGAAVPAQRTEPFGHRHHGQQRHPDQHNGRHPRGPPPRPARPQPAHRRQVAVVAGQPHRGQDPRRIDRELVRRRVHAGVEAGPAVVAQVGQLGDVARVQQGAAFQRGEHRAVPLAVPARVADVQLPLGLGEQLIQHDGPPPRRRCGPTRARWSARSPRGTRWTGCCRT